MRRKSKEGEGEEKKSIVYSLSCYNGCSGDSCGTINMDV